MDIDFHQQFTMRSTDHYDRSDLQEAASILGCSQAALAAVVAVESAGRGFDTKTRLLKALFEPHVFYRQLKELDLKDELDTAIRVKVARKTWDPKGYPKTLLGVYDQLGLAMGVNSRVALMSTSWGLGQILGLNHDEAGYPTVEDMVRAFSKGEGEQVRAMARFIRSAGLADELQRLDWRGFARGYNGPGYAKNAYHEKLEKAYLRLSDRGADTSGSKTPERTPVARMGSQGAIVRELQQSLNRLGFRVAVDGDFGPATKKQVRLLQLDRGLEGTGVVDLETFRILSNAPAVPVSEERANATLADLAGKSRIVSDSSKLVSVGTAGASVTAAVKLVQETGIGEAVDEATRQVQLIGGLVDQVRPAMAFVADNVWVVAVVALAGAAFLGYRIAKARLEDHKTGRTL